MSRQENNILKILHAAVVNSNLDHHLKLFSDDRFPNIAKNPRVIKVEEPGLLGQDGTGVDDIRKPDTRLHDHPHQPQHSLKGYPQSESFAVVQVGAKRPSPASALGLQYADRVALSLRTQPSLPGKIS